MSDDRRDDADPVASAAAHDDAHETPSAPAPATQPGDPDPCGDHQGGEPTMRLRMRGPEDFVAALPHMLEFTPTDSLILAALHDQGGRSEVASLVRTDLPDPGHNHVAVESCLRRLYGTRPDRIVDVLIVIVGGARDGEGNLPYAGLVSLVETGLAGLGLTSSTRIWTPAIEAGAAWCCYPPCGCRGVLPDPAFTEAAAAMSVLGRRTYPSRDDVAALVAPDPDAGSPDRARLIEEATATALHDPDFHDPVSARRSLGALRRAARHVQEGHALSERDLARLAIALCDPRVRDVCVGWALGAGSVTANAAQQLWTTLTRAIPAPHVAEPATLLALCVFVQGGGPLVGAALERARDADPEHNLSLLTMALLERGTDLDSTKEWIREASTEAAGRLGIGADGTL